MSKDYTDGKANLMEIIKAKEREKMEFEKKKSEIESAYGKKIQNLKNKFGAGGVDFIEEHLQSSTSGLVSKQDYMQKKEQIELVIAEEEQKLIEKEKKEELNKRMQKQEQKRQKTNAELGQHSKLSFIDDEQEENLDQDEEELNPKRKRRCFGKNPDVNTLFLEDKERVEDEIKLKKKLIENYLETQSSEKDKLIQTSYQYWDGSHHTTKITVKKGTTISDFISKAITELSQLYKNLEGAPVEGFMYIKGDYIIPQNATFLDIQQSKQHAIKNEILKLHKVKIPKKDSLYKKDLKEADYDEVEEDRGHKGKIIEKIVYEKSKHIFPFRNWKIFDPTSDYAKNPILDF